MASYLQLGDRSWNLLEERDSGVYSGLVLSPVNDGPIEVQAGLARLGDQRDQLEVILDPQMYNPPVDKGKMDQWGYFSADYATADHADVGWWRKCGREIVDEAVRLGVDVACSPALCPKAFTDDYYSLMVEVADATKRHAEAHGIQTMLTAIVSLRDLANPARAMAIASILSRSSCERLYLTFLNEDVPPRQPLKDAAGIPTAVHLVRLLSSEMRVHVAFASHDLVLWKWAGATDVSTGKYMNLRRFSPGRWREETEGGRQVDYWNEGPLMALLREADVAMLLRQGWFDGRDMRDNPSDESILEIIRSGARTAWRRLSWLQYLRWFSNVEAAWHGNPAAAEAALEAADRRWGLAVDRNQKPFLFHDRFNDGTHVRAWLSALREGGSR